MARTNARTQNKTANRNYSANLASGGSVSVRDGVKTYSDKGLQVRGNNGISISGQSFSRDRDGSGFAPVIPSDKVSPMPPLKMPTATVNDPGNLAQQMNMALAPSLAGNATLNPTTGMFDPVTGTPQAEPTAQSNLQAYLANLTAAQASQPNGEATMRQLERDSGLQQAKQDVNNFTGQLNSITAKASADQLRLEGQGRGITDTLIGGQQAQINREAAIAALPVQAQLAAAQGNLQIAQEHVDKMFSIRMQDAQNKYAFQTKIADTLFQYANAEQARKMQDKKDADNRAFSVMQNDQSFARQLAMQAVEFGQTGLAAKLGNLVPSSATYAQDIGALQGQLRKPVAPRAAPVRQTEMFEGKLIDSQTGEIIRDLTGGTPVLNAAARKEVGAQLRAGENLLGLVTEYRGLVKSKGFESTAFGSQDTVGKFNALRGQITAAYKDAKKLGTLDAGLLTLVDSIIGESPTSGAFTPLRNFFGGASNRIVNQLDSLITSTEKENEQARVQLGISNQGNNANFGVLTPAENQSIDAAFGINTSTLSNPFNPANFFKP